MKPTEIEDMAEILLQNTERPLPEQNRSDHDTIFRDGFTANQGGTAERYTAPE